MEAALQGKAIIIEDDGYVGGPNALNEKGSRVETNTGEINRAGNEEKPCLVEALTRASRKRTHRSVVKIEFLEFVTNMDTVAYTRFGQKCGFVCKFVH